LLRFDALNFRNARETFDRLAGDFVCPWLFFELTFIHECLDFILTPLKKAAEIGIMLSDPVDKDSAFLDMDYREHWQQVPGNSIIRSIVNPSTGC
jgi:hypothetical protein